MFCVNTLASTSYFKFSLPVPGTDTAVPDIIIPVMDSKVHPNDNSCDIGLSTILNHAHVNMLMLHKD